MNAKHCAFKGAGFFCYITYILLCTGFFVPITLRAQSDAEKELKEVEVKGQTIIRQGLTPSQKVSLSDFKRLSADNVADAVRDLSGVNIKDYGGIGGLKTISVRSLGANHTGVFYDGIQMNDAQNGQVDLGKLSLNNLQEIVLYNAQPDVLLLPARAFASASVLMINPLKPTVSLEKPIQITAGIKAGSFGLFEPMLQLDQQISKRWSYKINAFNTSANGRYKYKVEGDGSSGMATRTNTDINALQTDAAVYYTDKDSSNFDFRVNYYKSQRGLPGAVVFYNDFSAQRLWDEDLFIQSKYEKKWLNNLQLLLSTKLSQSYTRYLDPDYLNIAGELDQRYKQKEYYLSGAVSYRPLQDLELSYSADGAVDQLSTNEYQYAYPVRLTVLQVIAAKYTFGSSKLEANLLNTNIHEWVNRGAAAPPKSIYSPTLMYAVTPFGSPDIQFHAFYKDIFRNPTFNDLYYSRIGFVNLKPEYTKQYDLGFTFSRSYNGPFAYLTLTADAYYNNVTNKIIAVPNKDIFSWTMTNLGKVDIRGLDLSAKTKYQFNTSWSALLSANYTYQDAVDVTDPSSSVYLNQIPYTPKHTAAFNLGITHQNMGLYFNHILSSHRYYLSQNLPEYNVPGFAVSDASFSRQFKFSGLPVSSSFEVNNLFNTQYAFIRSFPMPGRSFRLSFKVTI
ncbi:TonB-dependent siderophore receptor [Pedobacter sp. L105]|uniref:TonB-dependent receptor plug domain-containing protein n=1 Tax=Pedobacter sp. L105 TaxID=1641871 RepID=UPI00131D0352|nr:TonB-dependent receptor [Pedobacter sp. L105]